MLVKGITFSRAAVVIISGEGFVSEAVSSANRRFVCSLILGLAIGLSSSPAAVYAAEIAHPNLRGRLTLLTALCTGIGMLIIYSLGYIFKVSGAAD